MMKAKHIIIGLLMNVTAFAVNAQPPDPHHSKEMREKIESQKIAFITTKLDLSPEEAQKFWPIYNEHHNEVEKLHEDQREMRKEKKDFDELSDEEILEMIETHMDMKQKELDLERKYFEEYKKVLSPRKLVKLHMAEEQFKKHLIQKLKGHRDGPPKHGGKHGPR